jgi:hypothetical protein
MVHYSNLVIGKKYKLGSIRVGKLVRKIGNLLYFVGSEHAEEDEVNEIESYDEDNFVLLKTPKKSRRDRTSSRRSKKQKHSE